MALLGMAGTLCKTGGKDADANLVGHGWGGLGLIQPAACSFDMMAFVKAFAEPLMLGSVRSSMSAPAFLREFIRNWKTVGAIAPSSPALAEKMVDASRCTEARHILELGPGTGAFTEAIARVMPEGANYLGLELNEAFVHRLHEEFPAMRFECCCAQQFDLTQPEFREGFDVIISGLPWTAFPESLQKAILGNVLPHLAPSGCFVTFAYFGFHLLPAGQHFRQLLGSMLPDVTTTEVVWANLPPAFVYVARRAS